MGNEKVKRTAIVCGGIISDLEWFKAKIANYDYIIAADSGYDYLCKIAVKPNVLIGDFDSVIAELPSDIKRVTFPSHKDKTDFSLCLDYCHENRFNNIDVFGAWGGRADHSFAAVFALYEAVKDGTFATIIDEKAEFCVLTADNEYTFAKCGQYVSAFAIGTDAVISYKGFEYPLNSYRLPCCATLGVSNKIIAPVATVHVHSGYLLLIIQN